MTNIYMDYNARAPLSPLAREAMEAAFSLCGNPSSPHRDGRQAKALMEDARALVAASVGAPQSDLLVWTSGGTEANALAMRLSESDQWLLSAVEHISVAANCPAFETIAVGKDGLVDEGRLGAQLKGRERPFVSIQLANNETGVIQPIARLAEMVHAAGGFLHCDGTQGLGKLPMDMTALGVDALSLSGHKCGAAPGVGALVFAGKVSFEPLLKGGGQEFGQRAGTENLFAIASFAGAIKEASDKPLAAWRDKLEAGLPDGATIFGKGAARLDNTSCFALPNMSAQKALILFDLAGISLSAGAACSSGTLAPSKALLAQGFSVELASGALRASLGRESQSEDIDAFLKTAHKICA